MRLLNNTKFQTTRNTMISQYIMTYTHIFIINHYKRHAKSACDTSSKNRISIYLKRLYLTQHYTSMLDTIKCYIRGYNT